MNARFEPVNTKLTELDAMLAHEQVWDAFVKLSRQREGLLRDNMAKSFGRQTVNRMMDGEYDELPSQMKRDDWNEERQAYGSDEFFVMLDVLRDATQTAMKLHDELAMNWIVRCPNCGVEERAKLSVSVRWQELAWHMCE